MFSNEIPKHRPHRYVGKSYNDAMKVETGCARLFKSAMFIGVIIVLGVIVSLIMSVCNWIANLFQ